MSSCDLYYLFLLSLYCRVKFLSRYWYIFYAYHIDKTNIIFHDNVISNWCIIDTIENNICCILRQYNISCGHFYDCLFIDDKIRFKNYIFGNPLFVNSTEKFLTLYLLIGYHCLLNKEMYVICEHMFKCQI